MVLFSFLRGDIPAFLRRPLSRYVIPTMRCSTRSTMFYLDVVAWATRWSSIWVESAIHHHVMNSHQQKQRLKSRDDYKMLFFCLVDHIRKGKHWVLLIGGYCLQQELALQNCQHWVPGINHKLGAKKYRQYFKNTVLFTCYVRIRIFGPNEPFDFRKLPFWM